MRSRECSYLPFLPQTSLQKIEERLYVLNTVHKTSRDCLLGCSPRLPPDGIESVNDTRCMDAKYLSLRRLFPWHTVRLSYAQSFLLPLSYLREGVVGNKLFFSYHLAALLIVLLWNRQTEPDTITWIFSAWLKWRGWFIRSLFSKSLIFSFYLSPDQTGFNVTFPDKIALMQSVFLFVYSLTSWVCSLLKLNYE